MWERPPSGDNYVFYLQDTADPVRAIEDLFTPSNDYKNRNLLYCDQVIHILHMEALLWARKKRNTNTAWLSNFIGNDPSLGKLRIFVPFWDGVTDPTKPAAVYLAAQTDGTFFDFKRIHASELQLGDHLIIYNHPAY